MSARKLTPAERGRLGGLATLQRHGRSHFVAAGQAGGRALHNKYRLAPYNGNDFLLVNRQTDQPINCLCGCYAKEWNNGKGQ